MKKYLTGILIIMSLAISCKSQITKTITGKAYTHPRFGQKDTIPVRHALVRLYIGDRKLDFLTGEDGKYSFNLTDVIGTASITIETSNKTTTKIRNLCSFPASKGIWSYDLSKFTYTVTNIYLIPTEICHCIPTLPSFRFAQNEDTPSMAITRDTIPLDTAFAQIMIIMNDLPKSKIGLIGSADRHEKNPTKLVDSRLSNIANKLTSLGINKDRIKIYPRGTKWSIENAKEKKPLPNKTFQRVIVEIIEFGDEGQDDDAD